MPNSPEYHPFTCPRCEQMPREAFAINPVTDDWLILYPEDQLIHIHFGPSTHTTEDHDAMGDFALEWWEKITTEYPGKRFFFISDLTRKDDSEVIEGKTRDALKQIRSHPQDAGGAVYGQTWAMGFLLNVMARFTKRPVNLRTTYEECVADYERWASDPENLIVE